MTSGSTERRAARFAAVALLSGVVGAHADWPTLRGNTRHDGYVAAEVKAPFRLAWVRHFAGERLGTAMEPIIADRRLFVATHAGNVYALDAQSGQPLWRFATQGSFLHAPAVADGLAVAGCTDGNLYALDTGTGRLRWSVFASPGGFSASPAIADGKVFIGSRQGESLAVELETGRIVWRQSFGVPIRQTAAVADGQVFMTAEDLRVRCLEAGTGQVVWTSEQLVGQTARDYYPLVVKVGGRTRVVVRTNPVLNMGQRIARDRHLLARNAGVDDSDWRKVDAWTKSEAARGTPELWAKEQEAITRYLDEQRDARTFFVLDGATGQEAMRVPALWIGGCQGVGAEPAMTADGRLLVFYRSAYGNWNHGVAPLVALGLLDLAQDRITPLFHQFGMQPQWNTFWGTADESQNFGVAGHTALIVHQGTLSGFDFDSNQLFRIWGERDTYGGFKSPAWARNEWHGPGRGSVAVVANRLYWMTGSRVLCVVSGESGPPAEDQGIYGQTVLTTKAPPAALPDKAALQQALRQTTTEILSKHWAPLFVDPGLAGRDFSFDDSGELFEALAWAWPHLDADQRTQARTRLADEWTQHSPFTQSSWYSLKEGERREWFDAPEEVWTRLGQDKPHHPFGNLHAVWLYAERCGEWPRVLAAWPQLKTCFEAFVKTGWRLDGAKGDLFANRYLASCIALERIAGKAGDREVADRVNKLAAETTDALVAWWRRAAEAGTLTSFKGSGELDSFIGKGDAISFQIAPHRHKVALLHDLTPEIARRLKGQAPDAVDRVWKTFDVLYCTWPFVGEERQVHFGENYVDPPDLALDAFKASAWLRGAPREAIAGRVDLPVCHADLYYLTKLALALETK